MVRPRSRPASDKLAGALDKEHAISQTLNAAIAVVRIDIGKNSFHIVGHDERGAIVLRQKWSRGPKKRLHHNVLAIALTNKPARIAWSVLARGRAFEARKMGQAVNNSA